MASNTLNVSFTAGSANVLTAPGAYTGDGLPSPTWNDVIGGFGGGSLSPLVYSDGGAATGQALSFTADNSEIHAQTPPIFGADIYSSADTQTVTLTGLIQSGVYVLYLYGENGFQDRGTTFSITTGTGSPAASSTASTQNAMTTGGLGSPVSTYILNVNYVIFNAISDNTGTLVISYTANPVLSSDYGGANTIGAFNGFQLIPVGLQAQACL